MIISWPRTEGRFRGFTLIELLTVIAVIFLLMALFAPAVHAVRRSVAESKTRSQFSQYALAYEAFRADYGFYPSMAVSGSDFTLAGNNDVFVETLSGRTLNGNAAVHAYARAANRRLVRYYTFSPSAFAGGEIVDAFGNPNIRVVIDRDLSGHVTAADFETLPPEMRPETLPGGVFFYSANPNNNPDWEWILSWE